MDGTSVVTVQRIYKGTSIVASGTGYTDIIDLDYKRGYMSLFIHMTGDGTASITPFVSMDPVGTKDADSNWTQPYDSGGTAITIATGLTKSTGPATNGQHVYPVEIPVAKKVKFLITETGGADAITPVIRSAEH